jgi:hypothetical protein
MNKVDLRTAYLLIVHKNPEQVKMFVRQLLCDEQADVYIHADKKSGGSAEYFMDNPRVTYVPSIVVTWGDVSMVDAAVSLLDKAVKSGKNYDFLCLRTGQDMMVRDGFKEYLSENRGKSFFSLTEIDLKNEYSALFRISYPEGTRRLYDSLHPYRLLRTGLRKLYGRGINLLPNNEEFDSSIRLFWGSDWFTVSGRMAEHMTGYLEKNPWYRNAFKKALAPSTIFFNTLAMNSPFAGEVVNETHTYLRFGTTYKTNNHPVIFTMEDIDEIESSGCYFARKFDIKQDKEVMEYFSGGSCNGEG